MGEGYDIDENKMVAYETRSDVARVECLKRDLRLYLEYYEEGNISLAKLQLEDVLLHRNEKDMHWT